MNSQWPGTSLLHPLIGRANTNRVHVRANGRSNFGARILDRKSKPHRRRNRCRFNNLKTFRHDSSPHKGRRRHVIPQTHTSRRRRMSPPGMGMPGSPQLKHLLMPASIDRLPQQQPELPRRNRARLLQSSYPEHLCAPSADARSRLTKKEVPTARRMTQEERESGWPDLNPRPLDPQSSALPTPRFSRNLLSL